MIDRSTVVPFVQSWILMLLFSLEVEGGREEVDEGDGDEDEV